jgi:hypothetical protein
MSYLDTLSGLAEMTPAHAGGSMGERDAAFALGRMGFEIIIGPGGPGGHQLTERGLDIVAFNPRTGQLWIVDNKASGGIGRAYDASAITRNLARNLADAMREVMRMPSFPHRNAVMSRLGATLRAVQSGQPIPPTVSRIVTNAGGYLRGIGGRLARKGVRFEDLTGAATRAARAADIARARARGVSVGRPTRLVPTPAAGPVLPPLRTVWRRMPLRSVWAGLLAPRRR